MKKNIDKIREICQNKEQLAYLLMNFYDIFLDECYLTSGDPQYTYDFLDDEYADGVWLSLIRNAFRENPDYGAEVAEKLGIIKNNA